MLSAILIYYDYH